MDQAKLDEYLRVGEQLWAKVDQDELRYKGKVIEDLERAREAVLAGHDGWLDLVKRGITIPKGSPIHFTTKDDFLEVSASQPDSVLRALRMLWMEDDEQQPAERLRAFFDSMPPEYEKMNSGKRSRVGTRLSLASLLLMGLGPEYPPFKEKSLSLAYRQTGYQGHPDGGDEGAWYEHALKFLDQLVQHSDGRPVDLLEAQSLVWQMQGWKGPAVDDPSRETPATLDELAEKLLLEPASFLSKTVWPLLKDKKQIIFQGPPGTGKTFVARELAKFLAGSEDRVRVVQFHPSYAYEDFVQGFRPTLQDGKAGFVLRDGPLLQMADQAWSELNERYFLVIDEINRGNLSKILGELYYLLEYRAADDKADDDEFEMQLQYSDEPFAMPPNLYIIGTMNTADRSIALVDLALRRRFHFVLFHPDEEPIKGLLGRYLKEDMTWIAERVDAANEKLGNKDAAIGPSYFMKPNLNKEMADRIWKYNVLPYIEEQLYGSNLKIEDFALDKLKRAPAGQPETGAGAAGTTTANEPAPQPNPATIEPDAANGED